MSKQNRLVAFVGVILLERAGTYPFQSAIPKRGAFMNATSKCAHPACSCVRVDGKSYYSGTCADAKGMLELTCQCQPTACQGAPLKVSRAVASLRSSEGVIMFGILI